MEWDRLTASRLSQEFKLIWAKDKNLADFNLLAAMKSVEKFKSIPDLLGALP